MFIFHSKKKNLLPIPIPPKPYAKKTQNKDGFFNIKKIIVIIAIDKVIEIIETI